MLNGAHRCAAGDEKPRFAPDDPANTAICRAPLSASPVVGTSRPPTAPAKYRSRSTTGWMTARQPAQGRNRSLLAFVRSGGDTWQARPTGVALFTGFAEVALRVPVLIYRVR